MSDRDVAELLDWAIRDARNVGKHRLHQDDCDSAAGVALAVTLRDFDPAKGPIRGLLHRRICRQIYDDAKKNERYENMPAGWWMSLLVESEAPDDMLTDLERNVAACFAEGNRSLGDIAAKLGVTGREVRRVWNRVRMRVARANNAGTKTESK